MQTVVNHFGTKEGLFQAILDAPDSAGRLAGHRVTALPDGVARAVELLVSDYERSGDAAIRALALEDQVAGVREILEAGRSFHRTWVERTFPGALAGLRGRRREQRLAMLIAMTDVYTWKLLRRDLGLSVSETEAAIREFVDGLYGAPARAAGSTATKGD